MSKKHAQTYREKHRERIRERDRLYREEHKEELKTYRKDYMKRYRELKKLEGEERDQRAAELLIEGVYGFQLDDEKDKAVHCFLIGVKYARRGRKDES